MKRIAILGSTGSIGTQTLEVIQEHNDKFEAFALTANNNADLLIKQAIDFKPEIVVIGNKDKYQYVKESLSSFPIKVFAGKEAIEQIVSFDPIDVVLTSIVGYSGLAPTIKAIEAGKTIALANKETLVVAGDIICELALKNKVAILPVDSEHSAIFQCLAGEIHNKIEKIILTASGGPFRKKSLSELSTVTKKEALNHPNWNMGAKITIDSASLMNKGFEAIEAKWLFNVDPKQIEVVIHPQSIIHSMVQFEDGSIKAQLGIPEMKIPIQYALSYPYRIKSSSKRISFSEFSSLTFEEPDMNRFPNLKLAYEAMETGGNIPCVLNAANEIVVEAFLQEKISFLQMSEIIANTISKIPFIQKPSYDNYIHTNTEARNVAKSLL